MIIKRGKKRYGVRIYRAGRQEWVGTFSGYRAAQEAEREALARGQVSRDEGCASFARRWVRDFPRSRASTNRQNGYAVKPFARDFGNSRMRDVTRKQARQWALNHRSNVSAVRAMFQDALDEGTVTENPFSNLRLPESQGRKNLVTISEDRLYELADSALVTCGDYGPTFRACILFAAYVGLRPAELFTLKWADLDFAAGEVKIKTNLGSTGEVTRPKNNKWRTVILPPPAAEALRSMPRRSDSPYVFTTPSGVRFSKTSHYYWWRAVRIGFGGLDMDFYELRHFCATHLLELGVSHADVAVQLGHTDGGALVMSTYGHPSEDAARERLHAAFASEPQLRAVSGGASPAGGQAIQGRGYQGRDHLRPVPDRS